MEQLSVPRERFLRYWSANMAVAFAESGGAPWLGFGYDDTEKQRMRQLASGLPGSAVGIFFAVTVVVYILLGATGIIGFWMPVLTWLYPNPADAPALTIVVLLAVVALFTLGCGLPLAMKLAAWTGDWLGGGKRAASLDGDTALANKIAFQLWRMTVIMVGAFIPGCMLFIIFNLNAGPFVVALKVVCGIATLVSIASILRQRPV